MCPEKKEECLAYFSSAELTPRRRLRLSPFIQLEFLGGEKKKRRKVGFQRPVPKESIEKKGKKVKEENRIRCQRSWQKKKVTHIRLKAGEEKGEEGGFKMFLTKRERKKIRKTQIFIIKNLTA